MISNLKLEKEEIEKIFLGVAFGVQKQIEESFQKPKKRVIILAGPTGSGKSDFALALAKLIHGEIISADSMQVYKGMDIGTAKVTSAQQQEIPHHLIDIQEIREPFNVVDFYYAARQAIQKIISREAVPIVVGGSGFYLDALIYGPPSGPPSILEVRQELEREAEQMGTEFLYQRLMQLDPQYGKTITKNDRQKIIRALEIIQISGKKVSKLSWKERHQPQNYDFRCWFLKRSRENLYKRIERRCDKMLLDGLIEEVEKLKENGLLENSSASQAIGYRQVLEYLSTPQTRDHYRHFVEKFKQASRNYAKRQETWFRKKRLFRELDLEVHDLEIALDIVKQDHESI